MFNVRIEGFLEIASKTGANSTSKSIEGKYRGKENTLYFCLQWSDVLQSYLLLSLMSKLCKTRTPCMHDSKTCAPWAPKTLLLKSKYSPAVDSLHAKPSSKFLKY